jgi:hypothetical protein
MRPHKGSLAILARPRGARSRGATGLYPVLIKMAVRRFSVRDAQAILYGPVLVSG